MIAIAGRFAAVAARVAAAAERTGRDPGEVTIVAVTKGHPIDAARAALDAGFADLGENRVAELAEKAEALSRARWHMVGRLQTNKVRLLPAGVVAIHSVDRVSLVEKLSDRPWVVTPDVYVEVNLTGEATKAGVGRDDLGPLLALARDAGLRVTGLMTVAPRVDDPEQARPVFREVARMALRHGVDGLSMGMTDDYEVAVEEGATIVRIGRAIFGERPGPGPARV